MWDVEAVDAFQDWWRTLSEQEQDDVTATVELLAERGPRLPFPYSSGIGGSRYSHMRELRIQSHGDPIRVFYAFDPRRVAVLLNGVPQTNANGESEIVPRSDAELQTLRELVASSVGYDESRGDQITVKSLPFAALGENGTAANPGWLDRLELNGLLRIALIGFFALAIIFVVLRPVLKARNTMPKALLDNSFPPEPALTGVIEPAGAPESAAARIIPSEPTRPETLALPSADPVARLRNMMKERHEESVKVLSGWIDNKESAQ